MRDLVPKNVKEERKPDAYTRHLEPTTDQEQQKEIKMLQQSFTDNNNPDSATKEDLAKMQLQSRTLPLVWEYTVMSSSTVGFFFFFPIKSSVASN